MEWFLNSSKLGRGCIVMIWEALMYSIGLKQIQQLPPNPCYQPLLEGVDRARRYQGTLD